MKEDVIRDLRSRYPQGWHHGANHHRNLLAVLAELEKTPLVPWIERVLADPDDGPARREMVDVVKQLEDWQLIDVKKKGRKGSKWKQYRFHSRAQFWIDKLPRIQERTPLHKLPTLKRHCPRVGPLKVPRNVDRNPMGVDQGDWCWHQHDPPQRLYLRRVIRMAAGGDPITVYAYGFPHSELMKDSPMLLYHLWEIGMDPFDTAQDLKDEHPRARAFSTCKMVL